MCATTLHSNTQVPSLQALSLGCVGLFLDIMHEQLGDYLKFLPADIKACLNCVARRRGVLSAALLQTLADDQWQLLDLCGCPHLPSATVLTVLQRLSNLQALDLTGCSALGVEVYKRLGQCCPGLVTLRVGGSASCDEAMTAALKTLLPHVAPVAAAQEADDWEEVAAVVVAAPVTCPGQLSSLAHIVWPNIPPKAYAAIQQLCPRITVNARPGPRLSPLPLTRTTPPPGATAATSASISGAAGGDSHGGLVRGRHARIPAAANPDLPLDAPLAGQVGSEAWQGLAGGSSGVEGRGAMSQLSIADKFKQAYVEQSMQLREKARREERQATRRQLKSSRALQEVNKWLDAE